MYSKTIDAKCPYCKAAFTTSAFGSSWAQCLWGEYAPSSVTHKCERCGKESEVKLTRTYRYSATKLKKESQ